MNFKQYSIKGVIFISFISILFNLSFTNTAHAWPDADCGGEENCMVIIGPRNPGIGIPGFGGGGGGGGSGGGGDGSWGGQFDPSLPGETREQCLDRIKATVSLCKGLYSGSGLVTAEYCRRLGKFYPPLLKACYAAVAKLTVDAFKWCDLQGQNQIMRECPSG